MSDQLLKKIGTYWTGRAAGYSKVNQEELAGAQRRDWLEKIEQQIHNTFRDREKETIRILDVGTGPGFFAIILAEAGYQVTAVDYTAAMLEQAEKNAGDIDFKYTFFHIIVAALVKTVTLRPRMNRWWKSARA